MDRFGIGMPRDDVRRTTSNQQPTTNYIKIPVITAPRHREEPACRPACRSGRSGRALRRSDPCYLSYVQRDVVIA